MNTEQKIVVLVIVGGLLVGFGVGYGIWGRKAQNQIGSTVQNDILKIEQDIANNQAAVIESMRGGNGSDFVEVANQEAGMAVVVARTVLSSAGWVAIFEDINGDLGNVLGARGFAAGEHLNSLVPLLRGTIAGGKYHVGIFRENGDGNFDRKTDTLLRAADGEMIGSDFTAW